MTALEHLVAGDRAMTTFLKAVADHGKALRAGDDREAEACRQLAHDCLDSFLDNVRAMRRAEG